jgi:hypothetical protein
MATHANRPNLIVESLPFKPAKRIDKPRSPAATQGPAPHQPQHAAALQEPILAGLCAISLFCPAWGMIKQM